MVVERFSAWPEFRRIDEVVHRALRGALEGQHAAEAWGIPLDVVEQDGNVVVRAAVPGVEPSKIDVTVEDGVVSIRAEVSSETDSEKGEYLLRERRTGSFYRAVRLPDSVDAGRAKSEYRNGVLSLTFPKQESKKARKIEVETA